MFHRKHKDALVFMKPKETKAMTKFKISSWHVMHYVQTEKLKKVE